MTCLRSYSEFMTAWMILGSSDAQTCVLTIVRKCTLRKSRLGVTSGPISGNSKTFSKSFLDVKPC